MSRGDLRRRVTLRLTPQQLEFIVQILQATGQHHIMFAKRQWAKRLLKAINYETSPVRNGARPHPPALGTTHSESFPTDHEPVKVIDTLTYQNKSKRNTIKR